MGYTGTRERIYQARTSGDVIDGLEDQLHDMGWMPLTRELRTDGSLRVVYERLSDEAEDHHVGKRSVPASRPIRPDLMMTFAAIVTVTAIVVMAWSGLVRIATP
jgi:hypothetical protein